MNDQLTLDVQLRLDWNFDNFISGENIQIISALKKIKNESASYFIWGKKGSGKTHLLNALCHDFQSRFPEASLAYLPLGEDFDFPTSCLDGLESCDLVCIENIDAVMGNNEWEQALFHFLNRMNDRERIIFISSNKPLTRLSVALPDLKSRISAALNFELKALKDDQVFVALRIKAIERGIKLDEDVLNYIEKRGPRDLLSLVNVLDTLDRESLKEKRAITVPFLKNYTDW
jgi:DnaA family protein